ncbi:LCP family protein [Paenibacillus turpanensis]|uniref:LCP family protein n=1 Tax=Paenibacillus turpanensis TaxID=2689078 RepID=UPI00140B91EF|nr:LCP family protein [Paenibacillus turpanensis]
MASNEPMPIPPRTRKQKPKSSGAVWKWLLTILALLLIGGAVYAGIIVKQAADTVKEIGTDEKVAPGNSAAVKPLTFLLLGLDTRKETGSLNTDVIMVASVNPASKSATVVSIPRDTLLKTKNKTGKANSFYSSYMRSNGNDSAKTAASMKKAFGEYLEVPVDYVAVVNFTFFSGLVDSVGGITVNVDMDMKYRDKADGTNINLSKGVQKLNGEQALDFVRYRKSNDGTNESSDFERNERQQQVIAELLGKLKSVQGLANLDKVLSAAGKNINTDIPSQQIYELLRTYLGISNDKINYIHLSGDWKSPYVYIDQAQLTEARSRLKEQLK